MAAIDNPGLAPAGWLGIMAPHTGWPPLCGVAGPSNSAEEM